MCVCLSVCTRDRVWVSFSTCHDFQEHSHWACFVHYQVSSDWKITITNPIPNTCKENFIKEMPLRLGVSQTHLLPLWVCLMLKWTLFLRWTKTFKQSNLIKRSFYCQNNLFGFIVTDLRFIISYKWRTQRYLLTTSERHISNGVLWAEYVSYYIYKLLLNSKGIRQKERR